MLKPDAGPDWRDFVRDGAMDLGGMFAAALDRHRAGDAGSAALLYRRVLAVNPAHADSLHLLGVAAHQNGRSGEAVRLIGRALVLQPETAAFHNNLGEALRAGGRLDEAAAAYRRAIVLVPDHGEALSNLGRTLARQDKTAAAMACHGRALRLVPDDADGWCNLGNGLLAEGRREDAAAAFQRALQFRPDHAPALNGLGAALKEAGWTDDGVTAFTRAVTAQPDYVPALANLVPFSPPAANLPRVGPLEAALTAPGTSRREAADIRFALGRLYDQIGETDRAFDHFLEGNRLKRLDYDYATDYTAGWFAAIKAAFPAEFLAYRDDYGIADPTPIFIVGMQRSGTTLVEQILASHPAVHAGDELLHLRDVSVDGSARRTGMPYPASAWWLTQADAAALAGDYLALLRDHAPTALRITDKMPLNFQHIGMIRLLLPHARIIHCRRDPRDTCLSIFKIDFAGHFPYAYDLKEIGEYYRLYEALMAHWAAVLPGFIHDVVYEDLIADQETQTRRLLAACGLDWDDACLTFHRTRRPVRTASAFQVRQPLYGSAVGAWTRNAARLAPLLEALESPVTLRGAPRRV